MLAVMAEHAPVLLKESLEALRVRPGGTYVDCTVGLGGHAREILRRMEGQGLLIAIDRDPETLELARARLSDLSENLSLHRDNFKNLPLLLNNLGVAHIDGCLVDLGVSRYQLTEPERGFSLRESGPLDMRADRDQKTSAADLVQRLNVKELTDLFRRYGEEPEAARIARALVEERRHSRFRTTSELAEFVARVKKRRSSLHPATLVFQALRIAVNQELEGLDRFLSRTIQCLKPGGRLVVISFHSLEDRIVKHTFQLEAGKCICFQPGDRCRCPRIKNVEILTRKPVTASGPERDSNPSARSAKMRAVERVLEIPQERDE
jgi:16S rRNA (cytosine1402-N4)-methyltransferase